LLTVDEDAVPRTESDRSVIGVADGTACKDAYGIRDLCPAVPAFGVAHRVRKLPEFFIRDAGRSMHEVMPHHLTPTPHKFIDDVWFASAWANQRFAPVNGQRINLDLGGEKEPFALADKRLGVAAMKVRVADAGPLGDFSDLRRHETVHRGRHGGPCDGGGKPMAFVEAAEKALRGGARILEA